MDKYHVAHTENGLVVTKEVTKKRFSFSKFRSILETNYEIVSKEGKPFEAQGKSNKRPIPPAVYHTWDKVMKEIKKWHNGDINAYEVVNKPDRIKK